MIPISTTDFNAMWLSAIEVATTTWTTMTATTTIADSKPITISFSTHEFSLMILLGMLVILSALFAAEL